MREPRRLLELHDTPLGRALRQAQRELGTAEQLARVRGQLDARLAPAASGSPQLSTPVGVKAWIAGSALVAGTLAAVIAWTAISPRVQQRPRPAAAATRPPAESAVPAVQTVSDTPPPRNIAPAGETIRPPQSRRSSQRRAPTPHAHATAAVVDPGSEVGLITEAQQALERAPEHALAVLAEHARRFERGLLAEERESLRVDALLGLGRTSEARAGARAFVARFPQSPHAQRFRELLADRNPVPVHTPTR